MRGRPDFPGIGEVSMDGPRAGAEEPLLLASLEDGTESRGRSSSHGVSPPGERKRQPVPPNVGGPPASRQRTSDWPTTGSIRNGRQNPCVGSSPTRGD